MSQLLLAGDVGGTKTRLAVISKRRNGTLERGVTKQYKSADHPDLQTIISLFLAEQGSQRPDRGCIGVPGPVANGEVKITNLPWELSEKEIESTTGLKRMLLVNDLFATAAAVPHLTTNDLGVILPGDGTVSGGSMAVVAPGTGLGMGFVARQGASTVILPSEGGHARFAPADELETELLTYLRKRDGYVGIEHLLCGPGIKNIFDFLSSRAPNLVSETLKADLAAASDAAAIISKKALSGEDDLCVQTLDVFLGVLGSHCGNIGITLVATGGIYLGGGIPPKIATKLSSPIFQKRFLERGKMSELAATIPVYLIKDDYAALTGAASLAAEG